MKMGQEFILKYLQNYAGEKFSADELKLRIGLRAFLRGEVEDPKDVGPTVYTALRKLRPKCRSCQTFLVGDEKFCPYSSCGVELNPESGIRAALQTPRRDSRRQIWLYWWSEK